MFADSLYDHCVHKGRYTRLDWSLEEWEFKPWDLPHLPPIKNPKSHDPNKKLQKNLLFWLWVVVREQIFLIKI